MNIALGVQPLQLQLPDPNAGMNALMRAMQIKNAMGESDLHALQLKEHQRGLDETNALNEAYSGALGADGAVDRNKLYTILAQRNLGSKIPGVQKTFMEADAKQADIGKTKAETTAKDVETAHKRVDGFGQVMGFVHNAPTIENAQAAVQHLVTLGVLQPEQAQAALAPLAQNPTPEGIRQWAQLGYRAALSAKDQLTQYQTRNTGGTTDTLGIDPVTGQTGVVNSVRNTQSPDNAATVAEQARAHALQDARERQRIAQAEQHFQAGQNAPQYMETDAGLVAVPRKLGAGQVPTAVPVMGPNGQPLGKPLKDIPPAVNGAIIQNRQSLNQIDRAMTLLGGTDIGDPAQGGQRGDKAATGMKGYLPQTILNLVDPKGVDARAEVADIGSLKIHDRSGAAVTISESPRLMPFIPQATDDAVTVKKKLARLKTELVNESNALAQTYSREQGYKPNPVQSAAPPSTAGGGIPPMSAIDAELARRAGRK